jgi:hypothetical protein
MRLLAALGCAGLTGKAFAHADLRVLLVKRFGVPAGEGTLARLSYRLTKLGHTWALENGSMERIWIRFCV